MPTAMSMRAPKPSQTMQANTPDFLQSKKKRKKTWIRKAKRKNIFGIKRETGRLRVAGSR